MIKGSAQKFETLQDGSCKLSIYYPREIKKQVLELEGVESISMSLEEYEALTSGKALVLDIKYLEFFKLIRNVADDAITEAEGV